MKAATVFRAALDKGVALAGNEAQVLPVHQAAMSPRAWFGYDSADRPVAYFETGEGDDTAFAVSKVIAAEALRVEFPAETGAITVIKLTCVLPQLAEVFFVFMDEVLERISDGALPSDAIPAAASEWRSLLQVAMSPMAESAAAGLYGELRFLEDLVEAVGPAAVGMWQRSGHDIHDFIADFARVEVKTSAFQDRSSVTIHGLRQLRRPQGATLTLAVAEVQKHGGETIDAVIERLLPRIADRETLIEKIQHAGYVRGMPGASDHTFTLLSWRFWEITDESPVLNSASLPQRIVDAVSGLRYSLNLGSLGTASDSFDFDRLDASTGGIR